ncbi:glycosyltransferase family 4 protein [Thauera sp.]|uniref:glycosyltransferase family 4 protein n=1 Tax=Thauera sp. TaxID=1905334 RepID=UPI00257DF1EB|nr:glycosyltransferase family 4 protein [Thauera sp.]
MKVAIVHDWLVGYAGAERVLEQLIFIFPDADLYTICDFLPDEERFFLQGKRPSTSFIQKLPKARSHYRSYLPLMPLAIEQFDLSGYDLIISSSHAVAKGVLTGPDQLHISYVHSPIRYAWDLQHQYLRESNLERGMKGWVAKWLLHKIRLWDSRTGNGVDHFIANSDFIARRIKKVYRRTADVIYPPVDVSSFTLRGQKDAFYLTASRLVPYKRIDLIIDAFRSMPDKQLVVIGDGPDMEKVRSRATPNIQLLGYQPFDVLRDHMQRARAFLFAAEEDFGIAPVEAQACGTPVVAFGKGGALETIRGLGELEAPTGVFFEQQTVQSVVEAVKLFEREMEYFSAANCRENAIRFATDSFCNQFRAFALKKYESFLKDKQRRYNRADQAS